MITPKLPLPPVDRPPTIEEWEHFLMALSSGATNLSGAKSEWMYLASKYEL